VASRTGDKRLVAPPANGASAGLCLALALAGLLLGGCGGGSSDPESNAPTASSTQVEESSGASGSAESRRPSKAEAESKQRTPASQHSAAQQSPELLSAQAQKHGPRIAEPKGPREQAPTPAEVAKLTVADMSLISPSLPTGAGGPAPLSAAYTCDGKDEWPTLGWSGVPAGTAELILYAMNVQPVAGKLVVDWAVAGIDPALTGIEAGKLPKGAVVGTNSFSKRGYEICPEGSEIYLFAIYALPRALSPEPGFDARELRKEILDVSGNVGLFPAAYARG
jgi:phosphatidylethanolamine-binding protein (PEBP) family uncharacterized protein